MGSGLPEGVGTFAALGVASFGPIDLNTDSETYGYITTTPKKRWQHVDVLGVLRSLLLDAGLVDASVPLGFDTDVNAAALAMATHFSSVPGTRKALHSLAYVTVGTGIGVGLFSHSTLVHGASHPEAGHVYVPRAKGDGEEEFVGTCPWHGACLEGLCATGAIAARAGVESTALAQLKDSHRVWDIVAFYLAHLCLTLTLTMAPQVVVLGGGVMQRRILFPAIRKHFKSLLNGYVAVETVKDLEKYIVGPPTEEAPGVLGALHLALAAVE